MGKEEKKEKVEEVIIVAYKVHLHCPKCAHDIRKPLLRTQGVQSVDVKFESGEITVKGVIEEKKIHERLEKWTKKKVEILPKPKIKAAVEKEKETKKEIIKTTKIKAYMHCDQCELDLKKKLIKHKGYCCCKSIFDFQLPKAMHDLQSKRCFNKSIHSVKTDKKAQTITIEGIIESEKLLTYMRKRVHKHAEIIAPKQEKKEEKVTIEVKSTETTKIVEFQEEKKVEVKTKEGGPYFVHYVYAPQLFSDENPHACSIM